MYDVISMGSSAEDIFIDTELNEIISRKKHFIGYPAGSKILIKEMQFFTGGGGSNTAVSFARLGLKTGYIGNLTKDISCRKILEEFDEEGIDFLGNEEENGKGSVSIILDSLEHHRTILVYKGVNDDLDFKEVKLDFSTRWLYLSSMMNSSFETQKRVARVLHLNGTKIAYNPSEYQAKQGIKKLRDLIKITEILVLNKEEAKILLGFKPDKEIPIKTLALSISKYGPSVICITDEDKGAYCLDLYEKRFYYLEPHKVKVIERTGAGDAFASGFVAGKIKGKDTEFSLQLGGSNAESTIQKYGAKNDLLTWEQAIETIAKNPFKIKSDDI